jgi:hypothetical protein
MKTCYTVQCPLQNHSNWNNRDINTYKNKTCCICQHSITSCWHCQHSVTSRWHCQHSVTSRWHCQHSVTSHHADTANTWNSEILNVLFHSYKWLKSAQHWHKLGGGGTNSKHKIRDTCNLTWRHWKYFWYFIFIVPCIMTFYEITNRCNCMQSILFLC